MAEPVEWFYQQGSQPVGPVSADVLRQLAAAGVLQPTSFIMKQGAVLWTPAGASEVFPNGAGFPAPPPAAPTVPAAFGIPPPAAPARSLAPPPTESNKRGYENHFMFGVVLVFAAGGTVFWCWRHRPLPFWNATDLLAEGLMNREHWVLKETLFYPLMFFAAVVALLGVQFVYRGLTNKSGAANDSSA